MLKSVKYILFIINMLHKKHATCVLHKMFEWGKVYCSCKPNFEIK